MSPSIVLGWQGGNFFNGYRFAGGNNIIAYTPQKTFSGWYFDGDSGPQEPWLAKIWSPSRWCSCEWKDASLILYLSVTRFGIWIEIGVAAHSGWKFPGLSVIYVKPDSHAEDAAQTNAERGLFVVVSSVFYWGFLRKGMLSERSITLVDVHWSVKASYKKRGNFFW